MEGYEIVIESREIGLVYSPDDNGYYWQELFTRKGRQTGDWLTSKIFKTKQEALDADEEDMEWGC